MPTECSATLFEFAPVEGRQVVAAFDGGAITSDAGALLRGETEVHAAFQPDAIWAGLQGIRPNYRPRFRHRLCHFDLGPCVSTQTARECCSISRAG